MAVVRYAMLDMWNDRGHRRFNARFILSGTG
jgi:hypothetical protein